MVINYKAMITQWINGTTNSINYVLGNVYIGLTSSTLNNPTAPLVIQADGNGRGFLIRLTSTNYFDVVCGTVVKGLRGVSSGANVPFALTNEDDVFFSAGSTERIRLKAAGQIGVGTAAPNANAILDISSTTMAFMPPRMTTTQKNAVGTPTEGMVVMDTTSHKLNYYSDSAWVEL